MNLCNHIWKRGLKKEEAIAYSMSAKLATSQPLNKMPRLEPLLKAREDWLKRQGN